MILNLLFVFFSSVLLISSAMVIVVQNSVYSVVFLVLSFVSSAGILFLIECEFFALIFLVVYVGAIAVLFLFVVMMLDVKTSVNQDRLRYVPIGITIGILLLIQIILFVSVPYQSFYSDFILNNKYQDWYDKLDLLIEIEAIGQILYTHYVLQFLVAGLILTLAVLGAVVLTINLVDKKSQSQVIMKQLSRKQQNVLNF